MKTVTIREAQHHLSRVLEMVEADGEVVITRRGKKIARLSSIAEDNSALKKVDWSEAMGDIKKSLGHLPKLKGSSVEKMREMERY